MGRRGTGLVGLVVGALALGACAGGGGGGTVTIPPGGDRSAHGLQVGTGSRVEVSLEQVGAADAVVAATWRAGFAALAASDEPGGAVVSPASLVVALAMLAEGASGASAATFDQVLGASGDARTDAVNALSAALARWEGDPSLVAAKHPPETPMVHLANQVVVDDDQTIAEPYLDRLVTGYGAGVLVTDLSSGAGKKDLDAWVAKNTGGLVEESAIQPASDLVLVLQNAIALAARWSTQFEANLTHDAPFTLPDGDRVDVPTMHQNSWYAYAELDGWRALRLEYAPSSADAGNPAAGLHADVMLPPEGSSAAADPATADPATVAALTAALDAAEPGTDADLALPKLDMTTKVNLLASLQAMGLGHLLTPETAGLDGLLVDPPGPPYVGQAWQQAVLQVDEEGTRAAAVTELGMMAGSARVEQPIQFVVDRPYLFVVGDSDTGWPLFLASVLDPRS